MIEENLGFVAGYTGMENKQIFEYNGKIGMTVESSHIDESKKWDFIKKQIENDLSNFGDIEVINYSSINRNYAKFEILSKTNAPNSIHPKYRISQPFTDSLDMPILAFDISKEKIEILFKEHEMNGMKIINLNEEGK